MMNACCKAREGECASLEVHNCSLGLLVAFHGLVLHEHIATANVCVHEPRLLLDGPCIGSNSFI